MRLHSTMRPETAIYNDAGLVAAVPAAYYCTGIYNNLARVVRLAKRLRTARV